MYQIEAIVRPDRVDSVKKALVQQGFKGFVVAEVQGYGRQASPAGCHRGVAFEVPFTRQAQFELSVPDAALDLAIDCIAEAASTGEPGCARIYVTSLADAFEVGVDRQSASQRVPAHF
jgi:nitrogen regulatory protein PII